MVMDGLTCDVRMLAVREIDPLDRPELREDLKCAEDRRPADTESSRPGFLDEFGGCEVALVLLDEARDRSPRLRQAVAGAIESGDDGRALHVANRTTMAGS